MNFDSGRKTGLVTFDEIVSTLSILFRGTDREKLCWVFNLYDSDRDGLLSRDDLMSITRCVYQILGKWTSPPTVENSFTEHCEFIFNVNILFPFAIFKNKN